MMQAPLELHKRLASKHHWQTRLFYCGIGAASLSLLAYALGLELSWHVGAVLIGTVLGFLIPVRPSQPWALQWLDTHAGLSYRTALEYPQEDPYGLHDALRQRAERGAKNVDQPSLQPWWLPLFALAFGLLLLPNVPWSLTNPTAPTPGASDTVPPAAAEESPTDPAATDADQPDDVASPEGGLADEADEPGLSGLEGNDAPAAAGDSAQTQDPPLDRDALEDFLRSLDEERASEGDSDLSSPPPDSAEEMQPTQMQPQEGEPGGEERADTGEEGEETEQAGDGEQAGDEGEMMADDGEQAGEEGQEEAELGMAESEDEGQEVALDGGEESPEAEEGEAASMPGAGEDTGEDQGVFADDPALEQGMGAGAEGMEAQEDLLEEELVRDEQNLQFLPGQRQDGDMSSAGVMRLPGSGEGEGPAGAAAGDFERGYERAITEGRIPVEYQEVLRDYFR